MLQRITDGRTDLVLDFLAGGGAPDTLIHGVPLVRWCAYYGDVSALKCLLTRAAPMESLGENLDLNGACFHGHWRLCQFLIERGANVNHPLPGTGETPLHAALSKANRLKYTPIVRILLAAGANPNCATLPSAETGSFMRDCRTKGETPLHRAAAFGNEEDIGLLLAAGAKVEARDMNGDTPLSWASWHLRPGAILHLLCYGPFEIHPGRRTETTCETASGSMERSLLGVPHLPGETAG